VATARSTRPQGEECDNGQFNDDSKFCTSSCKLATCGDGIKNGSESCDFNDPNTPECTMGCKLASCGNGVADAGRGV
jgi:hypothetical protein